MLGFLHDVLYRYPAHKAVKDGFLTPLSMKVLDIPGILGRDYQKEYRNNYCKNEQFFEAIYKIVKKLDKNSQILILVDRKDEGGQAIQNFLKVNGISAGYISGDDKKEVISQVLEDFNNKKLRILIGSSVIGEGINIKSTDDLILACGGKSEIKIAQAIGRAVRLYPGKERATVWDFRFTDTKYLEKHLEERIRIFNKYFAGEVDEKCLL